MRGLIQRQRKLVALRGGYGDLTWHGAELRVGIQSGAHNGDGRREHLDAAIRYGGVWSTLRVALGRDVEGDVAIQALILPVVGGKREGKHPNAMLFVARSAMR